MPLVAIRSRFAPLTPVSAGGAPVPAPTPTSTEPCVTCERPAGTPYCMHCGERRAADRPLHVRELFEEAWGEFASVDGRVVRSFWALVRHPGALTVAYVRGERLRYLTPLKLFLFVNVAFFLFATATGVNSLTTPLKEHLNGTWHARVAQRLVTARLAARHVPFATYAQQFDAVATNHAKTLVIALVPLFTLCVAVAQLGRRRPILQHVVFALHAMSVLLLGMIVAYYGLLDVVRGIGWLLRHAVPLIPWHHPGSLTISLGDNEFSSVLALLFCAWLAPALRRNYGGGWAGNVVRAAALTWSVLPVLFAYRAVLFFTTFWTT